MHDWAGTREREDALTVPCRDCHAVAGEPCVVRDSKGRVEKPLEAFPAHPHRMNDARRKQ
ncbi:zinc finger domain-containing protein [Mycolicibacterium setense]